MKITWLIDALRTIKRRFASWLSIVMIVLIGTTLILGLFFASSTVKKASTAYINDQNFRDYAVSCSIGIKEDEVLKLRELEGINDTEGQISFSAVSTLGENSTGVTVLSTTERISVPTTTQGTLPVEPNECAISFSAIEKLGAKIGDEIQINISTARFSDILVNSTYLITGIASHPDYMTNVSTDYIVLPLSSFDTSNLSFDYSDILVDANISEDTFTKSYKEKSLALKEVIEKASETMSVTRVTTMNEDLDKEYDNARKTAEEELSKGKDELSKAIDLFNETVGKALEELNKGEGELNDLKSRAEEELAKAKKQIKDGEDQYNSMLAEGQEKLEQGEKDMEKELNDAKWKLFDGFLQLDQAEKLLNEKEAQYSLGVQKLLEGKEELERGISQFNEATGKIDEVLNDTTISSLIDILNELPDISVVEGAISNLENAKGKDTVSRCNLVLEAYDQALEFLDPDLKKKFEDTIGITDYRSKVSELNSAKQKIEDGQREVEDGEEQLKEARALLDQGWFDLQQGKYKLADGQAELARREPEARKQLEDAKAEFEQKKEEGAKQLEDARAALASKSQEAAATISSLEAEFEKAKQEYNTQKAEGEQNLSDATAKYEEAKKEADDKLLEIKQQIDAVKDTPCDYIIQTRDVNFPFVQTKSYIKAIDGFFSAFTPLYAAIIAIVCFFTIAIIVEEQTSQIGTCKAFGMYESEIVRKYIVFGASGALFGAAAGVAGAFVIESLLIDTMKNSMAFSLRGTGHNIPMIILLPSMELLISLVAVIWSCQRYVKCSAVGLINGNEPVARYRKKAGISFSKGVYFKLVINNLVTDIGREIVSIVTIVLCVFIVGFGIDIKLAYEGALSRQMTQIWQYDITLTESGKITQEEKEKIASTLADYDTLYLPITSGVLVDNGSQVLTSIICIEDEEEFGRFYKLKDESGNNLHLSKDGVLATKEMADKNNFIKGSDITLISSNLKESNIRVNDNFILYAGKTIIMTTDYYEEKVGTVPTANTYYIKTAGKNPAELKNLLSDLPGVSQVSLTSQLREQNMSVVMLYNAVVAIVISFSVLLSFMILLNLSNILVAHRMRELLTMRINGFSNMQVIGYLVREVVLTGLLSIIIALSVGIPLTSVIIKSLETDAFMFVREPFAIAWIASVLINTLFSVTINYIAFRNVKKIPLTEINRF